MAVPTVAVSVDVHEADGTPIQGAIVTARLTGYDVYQDQIVDRVVESTTTDANGEAVLNLFPNVLGERGTFYQFTIRHPTTNRSILKGVGQVPDEDCELLDILGNTEGSVVSQSGAEAHITDLVAPGIIAKTGPDLYALRSIHGVAGQVEVTNGSGLSGNPTIGLASTITLPLVFAAAVTLAGPLTVSAATIDVTANHTKTRAVGVAAAGSNLPEEWITSFSGHAAGSTTLYANSHITSAAGANNIAEARTKYIGLENNMAAGTLTTGITEHIYFWNRTARPTTNVRVVQVHVRNDAGAITGAMGFSVAAVGTVGGTITTLTGYDVANIGHANITNAFGVNVADFTAVGGTAAGFRSQITGGANRWTILGIGDANSALAGKLRLGSNVAPAYQLDVTGGISTTNTIGGAVAGTTLPNQFLTSFFGHSGGTTDVRGVYIQSTLSGTNDVTNISAIAPVVELQHTAGTLSFARGSFGYVRLGLSGSTVGNVTTLRVHDYHIAHEGVTGTIGTATVYFAGDIDLNDGTGTVGTVAGFRAGDLGHATRITALAAGMYIANMTAGAPITAAIYSDITSHASNTRWFMYSDGNAPSSHEGNLRIGSNVLPTSALDVTGTITVSGGITTGAASNLSISTSGGEILRVVHVASTVNRVHIEGGTTGNSAIIRSAGETNAPLFIYTSGTGSLTFGTAGGTGQVVITDTASANRRVSMTGSNGGNPTITVTAGALALGAAATDIQWLRTNIALGGGAAATLGTIGGSGPAATAQRNWLRFIESDGTASFIPVFR